MHGVWTVDESWVNNNSKAPEGISNGVGRLSVNAKAPRTRTLNLLRFLAHESLLTAEKIRAAVFSQSRGSGGFTLSRSRRDLLSHEGCAEVMIAHCVRMSSPRIHKGNRERRSARRFYLSLPVTVRAVPFQQEEPLVGRTRDISTRGLYFTVDREFKPGSDLDVALTLPANLTLGTEVSVRARCKVLRAEKGMEKDVERIGLAVTIQRYDIVRPGAE